MIVSSSSDGRYVLVVLEAGEAVAFRDEIEAAKLEGMVAELGKALMTLVPTRFVLIEKKEKK